MFTTTDAILGAGNVLALIRNGSHRTGAVIRSAPVSGGVAVNQQYLARMEEVTSLTTGDIAGLLAMNSGNMITAGLNITSGTCTVPFKNRADGGTFDGASAHTQITGSEAFVIPTSIEATQDAEAGASATCEIHWRSSDGQSSTITSTTGNSITAEVTTQEEFGLGPVDINGTDLSTVVGVRVDPGIRLIKASSNGGNWPTVISIAPVRQPMIDVTFHDPDELATLLDQATALTAVEAYLRKRDDGGTYEADGTAEHIKFSFAAGIGVPETIDAAEQGQGSVTLRLYGKALAVSTASAIT